MPFAFGPILTDRAILTHPSFSSQPFFVSLILIIDTFNEFTGVMIVIFFEK